MNPSPTPCRHGERPPSDNGENAGGRRGFGKGRNDQEPSFEALPDSIPPQNLEAEEAVLGGILLDPMPSAGWRMCATGGVLSERSP